MCHVIKAYVKGKYTAKNGTKMGIRNILLTGHEVACGGSLLF